MTNAPSSGWKRGRFGENLSSSPEAPLQGELSAKQTERLDEGQPDREPLRGKPLRHRLRDATSPIEGRPWHPGKPRLFARGSPFGGAGERSETERARTLTEKRRRSDSIALPKNLLIDVWRLSGDGLALSVCFAATSPKGRGFGIPQSLRGEAFLLRRLNPSQTTPSAPEG